MIFLHHRKSHRGFTLMETVLYMSIVTLFLAVIGMVYMNYLTTKSQTESVLIVEETGRSLSTYITNKIREAVQVTTPGTGQTGSTLQVLFSDAAQNPVIITQSNGRVVASVGQVTNTPITLLDALVQDLQFSNVSSATSTASIQFSFKVTHGSIEQTFQSAATTRKK